MEKKLNRAYLIFLNILIVAYNLYIWLAVFTEKVIVTDDLKEAYNARHISKPYLSYIYSYLDASNMAARPVSGFVTELWFSFHSITALFTFWEYCFSHFRCLLFME